MSYERADFLLPHLIALLIQASGIDRATVEETDQQLAGVVGHSGRRGGGVSLFAGVAVAGMNDGLPNLLAGQAIETQDRFRQMDGVGGCQVNPISHHGG